jgi:hypothetical protein
MEMVGLFALTALLLAGLGIYGVISYIVTARTNEIGIRIALGAERSSILQMVLRQALGLAIAGAAVGRSALRRQADRSPHLCDRRSSSHRGRFARLLYSGPPCATGRSANRAET